MHLLVGHAHMMHLSRACIFCTALSQTWGAGVGLSVEVCMLLVARGAEEGSWLHKCAVLWWWTVRNPSTGFLQKSDIQGAPTFIGTP
jgi:hypothetical protein